MLCALQVLCRPSVILAIDQAKHLRGEAGLWWLQMFLCRLRIIVRVAAFLPLQVCRNNRNSTTCITPYPLLSARWLQAAASCRQPVLAAEPLLPCSTQQAGGSSGFFSCCCGACLLPAGAAVLSHAVLTQP